MDKYAIVFALQILGSQWREKMRREESQEYPTLESCMSL